MLSSAITSVSGASKVFSMGFVTYSNQAKINILKVPKKTIQNYGAVSIQCCLSMVNNLSKISKAKICVSITGIAGPKGGTKKTCWTCYIGIKNGKRVIVSRNYFKKKRKISDTKIHNKKALNLILKQF